VSGRVRTRTAAWRYPALNPPVMNLLVMLHHFDDRFTAFHWKKQDRSQDLRPGFFVSTLKIEGRFTWYSIVLKAIL
jgi:hypothetical protein